MVFKLVRIDSTEPSKIDLTLGKHLIGRGKFLHDDDSDKRVSRNHAELEVTEHSITLKSLHQNPCFYIQRHTTETQILQKDSEVVLSHGDKFGLIPDHFWYEVLLIIGQNSDQNGCTIENELNQENKEDKANNSEAGCNGDATELLNVQIKQENKEQHEKDEDKANGAETGSNDNATEPLNVQIKQEPGLDETSSPSVLNQLSTQEDVKPAVSGDTNSPMKRSLSTDSTGDATVKKVKTEPDDAGDARPGPSNDQAGSSNASNDNDGPGSPRKPDAAGPDGAQKPNGPLRERCMYGANCYRRNPAHKAQFSHPADSDWGAGARGACPWGAACRRRRAQHWRDHTHPPGAAPPRPPGMRMVQRHGNVYYINAHTVNFYDDHFQAEDSDGQTDGEGSFIDSADSDFEF